MRALLTLFVLLFIAAPISAQTLSPYLMNPELNHGYVDSCAVFWMGVWDSEHGGFYTNVDREGDPRLDWGSNKNMLTQSRNLYGIVRAYMMTGTPAYLELAHEAFGWLVEHGWDSARGGWYAELNELGSPTHPTADRSAFDQHYGLLGIAAYYDATRSPEAWEMLMQGYEHLEAHYWDDRPGLEGYYDLTDFDGSDPRGKSFNATVDAITTHLLPLYLMSGDPLYLDRMEQVAANIVDHLVASMPEQAIGFAEEYDSDWNIDAGATMTIMGHVLKAAWCLGRVYRLTGDGSLLPPAETLFQDVYQQGYDHDFGGPYKDYNRLTGEMLMWGNPDTTKAWWQMEQGITAGLELHGLLAGGQPLEMADETSAFFMEHFVDHTYGEVYENRTRYGEETWGTTKGNGYKAGYHSIETGYYSYLYGSLIALGQPVTLHYHIAPGDGPRNLPMTPLAIEDDALRLVSVELNGVPYDDFDPVTRALFLPGGVGGAFTLVFEPVEVAAPLAGGANLPSGLTLHPAYPNPFNSSTRIVYELDRAETVQVTVHDLLGRRVATLGEAHQSAGRHEISWRPNGASGLYVVRVSTGEESVSQRVQHIK